MARPHSVDFVEDPEVTEGDELDEVAVPEPPRRVKVLAPFQVVHDTHVYLPGDIAVVPESLADAWILNKWVEASA